MPVFQSRSPILHNYWIKKYNLKGAYGHFPVQIENVEAAVRGLSALGIAGCNITQPHKLMAMKLMDQLSGRTLGIRADITPQVARIDAHSLAEEGVTRLCYAGSTLHTRPKSLLSPLASWPEPSGSMRLRSAGTKAAEQTPSSNRQGNILI